VHFLITENQTDLAAECGNKTIIKAVCDELLEDNVTSPEAGRIYLKCLEYDRTDLRIHRMLADMYGRGGDFKRAVSELTILHQLDRDQSDAYIEEAARLYVDNDRVPDALAEGNPLIIKKIAQIFLSKSQVHPDAVATYERVLEFQPRAVGINKMLATVYLTRGDPDKYMARLRLLHEIDGANHDYMNDLAICIIDNGLVEQTIKEGNRELNASILKHLIKSGAHDDKAIALLEKLIKYEPDNAVLLNAIVNAYENRSNHQKCFEHLLNLIKVKPENKHFLQKAKSLDAEHHLVEPLLKQGQRKLLADAALALIDRHTTDTFALNMMELVRSEESRINEYLASLNRPEKKSPPKTKTVELPVPPPDKTKKDLQKSKPRRAARKGQKTPSDEPEAHAVQPKSEKISRSTENEKPQSAPAAPPTPDSAGAPTNETSEAAQVIELLDAGRSSSEAVTTFVSGHAKGIKAADYNPSELFRPATGGLAYKDTDLVFADGWGSLSKGIEINTGRKVLMRIIRKDLLEPESMRDFSAAIGDVGFNLVHDNILKLEDLTSGSGGVPAFIYPLLDFTLEQTEQSPKRPELETLISITGKIVDGVAFAHQYKGLDGKLRRTFHLHLQPSNVLISADFKKCQILGFGYSQIFRAISGARRPRWQDPGMNPVTMPPEFFSSQPGVIREKAAEIYSLGVLMYFILAGEYPFMGPALLDFKVQHRTVHATPPKLVNPAAPNWLELIIMKCLEKDPENRWDNLMEIQKAFHEGANRTT
jgi:tetratricopeptide (TPR) repeat protein